MSSVRRRSSFGPVGNSRPVLGPGGNGRPVLGPVLAAKIPEMRSGEKLYKIII